MMTIGRTVMSGYPQCPIGETSDFLGTIDQEEPTIYVVKG